MVLVVAYPVPLQFSEVQIQPMQVVDFQDSFG